MAAISAVTGKTPVAAVPNMLMYVGLTLATTGDTLDTPLTQVDVAWITPTGISCTLVPSVVIGTGSTRNRVTIYGAAQTYNLLVIGRQ